MTNFFLMYNMGNSGGSWLASALNTYPGVHILEEPRRKLGYHPTPEGMTDQGLQKILLNYLRKQEASGKWQVVGYIKGFRRGILQYCVERGARVLQQFRHPIKVLYGTRKRVAQPARWWGRPPENEQEYFEGHVCWMAVRYRKYLSRISEYPLVRLEDLSASLLTPNADFFRDTMEYATQCEWDRAAVDRVRSLAQPRHRIGAGPQDLFKEGFVHPQYRKRVWPELIDPPIETIWQHWAEWQHEIFLREFEEVMIAADYSWPS